MFSPSPAMGTMLYAKEVPSAGGDTLFTNQYLTYESLSDAMKATAGQLRTVCVGDNFKAAGSLSRKERYGRQMGEMKVKDPGNVVTTSVHPLVRHSSGAKAITMRVRVGEDAELQHLVRRETDARHYI